MNENPVFDLADPDHWRQAFRALFDALAKRVGL